MNLIQLEQLKKTEPENDRIYLASPTMHGDEQRYINEAFDTNWVSTIGANIDAVERNIGELIQRPFTVALSSGTAALHMAVRACAEKLYGRPADGVGSLRGKKVFCSDLTFAATVNPVLYEGGEPVFIDAEYESWNMDPAALERAFSLYPEVRMVVLVHLYGTPAKVDEIRAICDRHQAMLVEDAAESLGATYHGRQTGSFGDIGVISFNGNKIITGSCGGLIVCDAPEYKDQIRKWSTQSREPVAWYQHEELGYNYRMSNIIAGIIRGQLSFLDSHILLKKKLYNRYREGLADLPITMNPYLADRSAPNHWLSCILIAPEAMCAQHRYEEKADYTSEAGKTCPTEILKTLASFRIEGRPIWKPMHLQPFYREYAFVNTDGHPATDVGADIFARGLCLPSDIKMTDEQVDRILRLIRCCFL